MLKSNFGRFLKNVSHADTVQHILIKNTYSSTLKNVFRCT